MRQYFDIKESPVLTIPRKFWFIGWWTIGQPLVVKFPINLKGYIEGDLSALLNIDPNNISNILTTFIQGIKIVFTDIYGFHIQDKQKIELKK